ncbi:hypothetical protein [Azospirillum picis]|nr:hypothetical protein [Azospirillum picis]
MALLPLTALDAVRPPPGGVPAGVARDPLGAGRRRVRNGLLAGLGGVAAAAALAWVLRPGPSRAAGTDDGAPDDGGSTVRAGRRLNRAAALLGASVLADSAVEHYRGSFHNPAMITPLLASGATIAASLHGSLDRRPRAHRFRDATYAAAALTGIAGTAFHLCNVTRRPGGLSWLNLFYGAPIGAPAAIGLAGLLGFAAERVRHGPDGPPSVAGLPAPQVLTVLSAAGILGTVAETALLHFRGAYHNPAMYLPVTIPPAAAAVLLRTLWHDGPGPRRAARLAMRATAGLGLLGTGFHAFGVHRNMGGWGNWRQNILNGPPLPAPPSYTALAFAGLAALALRDEVAGSGREQGDGR